MSEEQLREIVMKMRKEAQERLIKDRDKLFPNVSDIDFYAVTNALGEISIIEARTILYNLQSEYENKRRNSAAIES